MLDSVQFPWLAPYHYFSNAQVTAFNRRCGIDVHEIGPDEVKRRFPLCDVDDIIAGFLIEDDGRVNPVDATASLARGARSTAI